MTNDAIELTEVIDPKLAEQFEEYRLIARWQQNSLPKRKLSSLSGAGRLKKTDYRSSLGESNERQRTPK
jgi:hypothetical protein